MATNEIDDPEFWRFRAEEVRRIAVDVKVVEEKVIITRIAADYERIADLVEQRLRGSIPNVLEQWLRERKQQL